MPDSKGDDALFNHFDVIIQAETNWATAVKVNLHFESRPDGCQPTIIDNVSMLKILPLSITPTLPPFNLTFDVDCSVGPIINSAIRERYGRKARGGERGAQSVL